MANLVQKFVVHKAEEASPLLPQHIALVDEQGGDWTGGGAAEVAEATTKKAGTVKKASAVTAVSAEDAAEAAESPTKEEFDKLVALANANKAAINALIENMKSAGQME